MVRLHCGRKFNGKRQDICELDANQRIELSAVHHDTLWVGVAVQHSVPAINQTRS